MKRIYIAGPYSSSDPIQFLNNIRQGIRAGTKLLQEGYAPFCPWLDYQFQFMLAPGEEMDVKLYHDYSKEWLKVSDAIYLLPGWETSIGVEKELIWAMIYFIPICSTLEELSYI